MSTLLQSVIEQLVERFGALNPSSLLDGTLFKASRNERKR